MRKSFTIDPEELFVGSHFMFFVSVFSPFVEIRILFHCLVTGSCTLFETRFGIKRRFVALFEWLLF